MGTVQDANEEVNAFLQEHGADTEAEYTEENQDLHEKTVEEGLLAIVQGGLKMGPIPFNGILDITVRESDHGISSI